MKIPPCPSCKFFNQSLPNPWLTYARIFWRNRYEHWKKQVVNVQSPPPLDIPHFSGIPPSQASTVGNTKGRLHAKLEPDPAQTGREPYENRSFSGFQGAPVYQAPSRARPNIDK